MQNKVFLLVLILVAVGASGLTIYANMNTTKVQQELYAERYNRMIAEEDKGKAMAQIKKLEVELDSANQKIKTIQEVLQEKPAEESAQPQSPDSAAATPPQDTN